MESKKPLPICIKCAHTPICKNQPQPSCPYFSLKPDPSPRPKPEPKVIPTPPPKKSFFRKLWRVCLWVIVIALMIGSFLFGQYSVRTQLVTSLIPPHTVTPIPDTPPDQVVRQFFESLLQKNLQVVLGFCHPAMSEYRKSQLVDYTKETPPGVTYTSVEIVSMELDESAKVMVTYTLKYKDHQTSSSETDYVLLKKHQGQWLIRDF